MNVGAGPYPVPVVKDECVNHVSKRLVTRVTRLRKLKGSMKASTQTHARKTIQQSALAGKKGFAKTRP